MKFVGRSKTIKGKGNGETGKWGNGEMGKWGNFKN
jgi:hypothetical protein